MPKVSYAQFRAEVLALYTPPLRSKSTYFKMRQVLDTLACIGVQSTAELTPPTVARFLTHFDGRSEATVRGLLGYLSPICKYAHEMGYSRVNPFAIRKDWYRAPNLRDDDLGGDPDRSRHVSLANLARLLDHLAANKGTWKGARLHALVATVAYTGVRRNEALTRAVADFDLDGRVVGLKARRRRLKTKASTQPIGLPPELVAILADWLPQAGSVWAFPGLKRVGPWLGGPTGCRAFDEIRRAGQEAGIGSVNFLQLRHSWATHAEVHGLGELAVQRQLRHTNPRTQGHYRHADAANVAAAVANFSLRSTPSILLPAVA